VHDSVWFEVNGQLSVVVAASAAHRAEAVAAARVVIDQVKQAVPIWKKGHRADGTSEWVACHEVAGRAGAPEARSGVR